MYTHTDAIATYVENLVCEVRYKGSWARIDAKAELLTGPHTMKLKPGILPNAPAPLYMCWINYLHVTSSCNGTTYWKIVITSSLLATSIIRQLRSLSPAGHQIGWGGSKKGEGQEESVRWGPAWSSCMRVLLIIMTCYMSFGLIHFIITIQHSILCSTAGESVLF